MANNSLSSIRTALNTHLSAVTQLKQVKIGRDPDHSGGFPYCRFFLSGIENEPTDNAPSDYRTYRFTIEVIQEITNKAKEDAEEDFQDAVDAVLDKLNSKWQVADGSSVPTVDNSVIESSSVQLVEINAGPAVMLSIIFSCKTLIS
jgi:hypothetical protein